MFILPDQIDLLRAFNAHNVRYLVVGGHAVNIHSEAVYTKYLDLWIRNDAENSKRVFAALVEFGAPLSGMTADDFCGKPNDYFQIGIEPDRIDIVQSILGVSFEEAWASSVTGHLAGVPVRLLSADLLIKNKTAVGRPKDLAAVAAIQEFAAEAQRKEK
jgi:hypothetical protein